MKVAVKFHKDLLQTDLGMPGEWPAQVAEIDEATAHLEGYTIMSVEGYTAYLAHHQPTYDRFKEIHLDTRHVPHKRFSRKGMAIRIKRFFGFI